MTTPHCNINLIWTNLTCRDALFEKLLPRTKRFSMTTELEGIPATEDSRRDEWSVNVYCTEVGATLNHILELQRTRHVKYVAVLTQGLSQDVYHAWHDKLQAALPEGTTICVFDPAVGGTHYENLIKELEDELRQHTNGTLRASARLRPTDEEGHW